MITVEEVKKQKEEAYKKRKEREKEYKLISTWNSIKRINNELEKYGGFIGNVPLVALQIIRKFYKKRGFKVKKEGISVLEITA